MCKEWPRPEDFIESHWVELEDLHLSAYTPVDYGSCDTCPAGKQLHIYAREIHASNSFYNNGAYLNTLDREATDAFIESTHEKYREQCSDYFGNAINGQSITRLEKPESWMDIALKRLPLAVESLQVGCNILSLPIKLRSDTDLEAVYLLGDFSVTKCGDGFTMGTLPEQLVLGDLVDQGLVFYSGAVSYLTQLPQIDEGRAFVCELSEFAGACASIHESTHEAIVAFPPYRADFMASTANPTLRIDVTLTRQNLFGPFHQLVKGVGTTGPSSFRTVGVEYTEGYEFFPSGLLEAPVIRY